MNRADAISMDDTQDFLASVRRATLRLGFVYWLAIFILTSILWGIVGTNPIDSALGKFVHYVLISLMTFGVAAILSRTWNSLLCFVLAFAAAMIVSLIDDCSYTYCIWPEPSVSRWKDLGYGLPFATAQFFGWSCLFQVPHYSFEIRDHERRPIAEHTNPYFREPSW